jgi:hypothetical protein
MAVKEIMDYLDNGNLRHSVNYPDCDMGVCQCLERIAMMHRNVPNMIGQISSILARHGINIENMTNKGRGRFAYTLLDLGTKVEEDCAKEGYQTTVRLIVGETEGDAAPISTREVTVELRSVDAAAVFTNSRDAAVPTGLSVQSLDFSVFALPVFFFLCFSLCCSYVSKKGIVRSVLRILRRM